MTIAISLKINDGLVLAADSASTVTYMTPGQLTGDVINVYNNANKIFNLHKGLPIGAITWGGGSIGRASIETLVKDLRRRLSNKTDEEWGLDPLNYTVRDIADKFRKFVFDELYTSAYGEPSDSQQRPEIGFIVAGYSSDGDSAEEYSINIRADGTCDGPTASRPDGDVGVTWAGQPEALNRLIAGYSSNLPSILQNSLGVPADQIPEAMTRIHQLSQASLIVAPMPLQDAVDLAEFLVETTIKFTRFSPGPSTVGGPVEIAAISKHEGFRWIRRKHYFSHDLNRLEVQNAHSD